MNFLKTFNVISVQTLTSTGSTAASASAQVDMLGYDGVVFVAPFSNNSGTGVTLDGQGSTVTSTGFQNYLNAQAASTVAAGVVAVDLYRPTMRYARSNITVASTATVIPGVIAIQYGGSKFPITQGTTSVLDSTFVAGATT